TSSGARRSRTTRRDCCRYFNANAGIEKTGPTLVLSVCSSHRHRLHRQLSPSALRFSGRIEIEVAPLAAVQAVFFPDLHRLFGPDVGVDHALLVPNLGEELSVGVRDVTAAGTLAPGLIDAATTGGGHEDRVGRGEALDLLVAAARTVVHPKQYPAVEVSVGASHLREVAVVADHD